MDDSSVACVNRFLKHERDCDSEAGLAATEMGDATLPTLSEAGCVDGDAGMLNSVDTFARAGENIGDLQCSLRAAQMLCGVTIEDPKERAAVRDSYDSRRQTRAPASHHRTHAPASAHRCFCLAKQQCQALAASHF
jgi:hypothetical protein